MQDTDGDGLPEFVDAWGQPLQFFRWPVLYHSDLQRGQVILPDPNFRTADTFDLLPPYQTVDSADGRRQHVGSVFQERERDTLDPNQQLTAPQWWSQTGVGGQLAANNSSPFVGKLRPAPIARCQRRRAGIRVLFPPADRAGSAGLEPATCLGPRRRTIRGGRFTPSS